MTLKSIELAGFKSFGRKSSVSFLTPITAIVGPNGSGKSNIVESIRFVLGEQSMKSLRGKGGVDLIFKGSKSTSSSNRAMVTITFDNSKKIFSFTNSGLGVSLDYDEVSISREVFADGANRYSINGTEVRLKDVIDLLSSVNIGSSGHHIISQGEADRVLNASNKDRRSMIEDALGLKIYQYRIREAERKLDKTILNMKEVQASRREVAPHLAFLKKQVQIVEKAREMKEEVRGLYKTYFSSESTYIRTETKRLTEIRHELDQKIRLLDERISDLEKDKHEDKAESEYEKKIKEFDNKIVDLRSVKDELVRKLGRIEGVIASIEREFSRKDTIKEKVIPESEWKTIITNIQNKIDEALKFEDLSEITNILHKLKEELNTLDLNSPRSDEENTINDKINNEYEEMKNVKDKIVNDIDKISEEEKSIISEISSLRVLEQEMQVNLRSSERVLYEAHREKNEVVSSQHSLHFEEEKLLLIKNAFEMELAEAGTLIGREVMDYARIEVPHAVERQTQEDLRRKIERIKIKLEDAGSSNGSDVLKEYKDTEERDLFLANEITDLNKSIESLRLLIQELKETLDTEFKGGVEKINKQFQEFFSLMFGGGSAFLSVVMEHKKSRTQADEYDDSIDIGKEEDELGFERGIEINVTLPHKKVRDLHMLSGGERSLTSIALLFAISQVNPPPFLVLDETDAALDEANSRKYGDMLENLSKYSQLIVVTHNRETMSRANVLYGVTMDSTGVSKLLSIHLEDASAYAK
ncbi:MAG: AAA family ATPase [Patescibacteria group bacterium]|nr:AAA family ATPase [Patescibacteria group bacterium]